MNSRLLQILYRTAQNRAFTSRVGSSANYSCGITNGGLVNQLGIQKTSFLSNSHTAFSLVRGHKMIICSAVAADLSIFSHSIGIRLATTQAKAPPQARQMGALKVSMLSPGIIYEPYSPRQPIPFWQRWFTRSGWRRTKDDIILELKSAYAIAKLRKKGYSKKQFYEEAVNLYKEINTLIANGDKTSLRKAVTENMYSALKNEIKLRESKWNKVYWEMILPVVKIRTLVLIEVTSKRFSYSLPLRFLPSRSLKHIMRKVLSLLEINLRRFLSVISGYLRNLFFMRELFGVSVGEFQSNIILHSRSFFIQFCRSTGCFKVHFRLEKLLLLETRCHMIQMELHSSKVDDSCVTPSHIGDKSDKNHHFVPLPSTIKHAPKKIVSIKETVEDIDSIMKERRKNKGTKKSKSFDFDNEYDGSLKPTRSILKVGSLNDKSDLLNSLNRVE
ncbi:hypothetical protein SDJN03_15793, partial [Cucurbita argyrosperma subsp. sororia]